MKKQNDGGPAVPKRVGWIIYAEKDFRKEGWRKGQMDNFFKTKCEAGPTRKGFRLLPVYVNLPKEATK